MSAAQSAALIVPKLCREGLLWKEEIEGSLCGMLARAFGLKPSGKLGKRIRAVLRRLRHPKYPIR